MIVYARRAFCNRGNYGPSSDDGIRIFNPTAQTRTIIALPSSVGRHYVIVIIVRPPVVVRTNAVRKDH